MNAARGMSLDRRLTQYVQSNVHLLVSRILSSDTQRPSGVYEWQMPLPVELPMPPAGVARFAPLDAHEASYFAASARMASLARTSTS